MRGPLTTLVGDDQRRLGLLADWKTGPHLLTYRQTEYAHPESWTASEQQLRPIRPDGLDGSGRGDAESGSPSSSKIPV